MPFLFAIFYLLRYNKENLYQGNVMRRCVIIGGADISNYEYIRTLIREDDYVIFCDCGLKHKEALGIAPHLIVGDFDSFDNPLCEIDTIVLPTVKDDTDTFFAVKEAVKRGYDDFLLFGVIGARLDHTLGNISILLYLHGLGKSAVAVDDFSQMEIVASEPKFIDDSFSYFSLLNITGKAKGITIENAKYNLSDAEITPYFQYGVSNEVIKGERAKVFVNDGELLLIKVF